MFRANYPGIGVRNSSHRLNDAKKKKGANFWGLAKKDLQQTNQFPVVVAFCEAFRGSVRGSSRSVAHNDSIRRDLQPNGAAAASSGNDYLRRR